MEQIEQGIAGARLAESEEEGQAPRLPPDVLRATFRLLLQPHAGSSAGAGMPARPLAHQWFALRLVCRSWATLLDEVPLSVELWAAPLPALTWLQRRPLRLLRMVSYYGAAGSANDQGMTSDAEGQRFAGERTLGSAPHAALDWGNRPLDSLVAGIEGVREWHRLITPTPKFFSLAALQALEVLHLEGPINRAGDCCTFDAASLSSLPRLAHLQLECFYNYSLEGLPPCLRTLDLRFVDFDVESAPGVLQPGISVFALPESSRLEQVVLRKQRGPLALAADAVFQRTVRLRKEGEGPLFLGLAMPEVLWRQAAGGEQEDRPSPRSMSPELLDFPFRAFFGGLAAGTTLLAEVTLAPERTWWLGLPPDPQQAAGVLRSPAEAPRMAMAPCARVKQLSQRFGGGRLAAEELPGASHWDSTQLRISRRA